MTAIHWWHSQHHQCHHECQPLHRIRMAWWLEQAWHPNGLGIHWSLWLWTNHSSAPPPPSPSPSLARRGGCCRVAELHPDWWGRCPPERWGWWSNQLREWGSPASHGSVVGDNPSLCRHGALDRHPPPILWPWLRSPPEALFQLDFQRHFCGGEALTRRVSFVSHGLVSGVQRGTLSSHYHEGMAK